MDSRVNNLTEPPDLGPEDWVFRKELVSAWGDFFEVFDNGHGLYEYGAVFQRESRNGVIGISLLELLRVLLPLGEVDVLVLWHNLLEVHGYPHPPGSGAPEVGEQGVFGCLLSHWIYPLQK